MSRAAGRVLTAVGLAFALVMIAGGTTSLISVWWLRSEDVTTTFGATSSVRVYSGCGSVTVEGEERSDIELTGTIWWSFTKPRVESTEVDGVRVVQVSCDGVSLGVGNTANVTLHVPSATAVTVRASASALSVRGLAGDLDLRSDGGAVEGSRLDAASVRAASSAGTVRLSFTSPPRDVTASSSGGSVTVLLPTGAETYHVTAKSSGGSTDVRVRTDPQSARAVDARSSAGSVLVDYVG